MNKYRYCTPEWLHESGRVYRSSPELQENLKKVTTKICFRVTADKGWGIDEDIIFGAVVEKGALIELDFFSDEAASQMAEFIVSATPQEWKLILRKDNKFITDFMLGKIQLEKGSKVGIIGIAPYAPHFVEALTQVKILFPDEMSAEELEEFRADLAQFRSKRGL
jgi:putative sterol carrier protein